jgi:hypothetical protein
MSQQNLNIARNSFGQLVFTDPDGKAHLVTPVRAFPSPPRPRTSA